MIRSIYVARRSSPCKAEIKRDSSDWRESAKEPSQTVHLKTNLFAHLQNIICVFEPKHGTVTHN